CGTGGLAAVPLPLDAAQRARYEAMTARIQAIEGETSIAAPARTAKLRALEPEITSLAYPPLDARWHWGLAHTLSDARDLRGAAEAFDRAAEAGLAAGDDDLYVRAMVAALHVTSSRVSPERLAQLEAQASAGAARLGNPHVDAELLLARAKAYMDRGDSAKARGLLEQADARYTAIAFAPMMMHVSVLQNLGALCLEAGDLDAADRALARTVALARLRYGEAAPYWEARSARASVLLAKNDLAAAEVELRAVATGLERTAPDGGQLGMTRAYLCALLTERAQLDDARVECARSVAAIARSLGADSPGLVWPLTLSGQVELRAAAVDAALVFLERAVALAAAGQVRVIETTIAQANLAIALRAGNQPARARALARKVAPALVSPDVAETRRDFVRAFPELERLASPAPGR
ncbi:MAG: hypothetical protein M3680_34600, partial [Myxococcota bacterium]|nr:hypothetical protein [Myxococcota bacterium]